MPKILVSTSERSFQEQMKFGFLALFIYIYKLGLGIIGKSYKIRFGVLLANCIN